MVIGAGRGSRGGIVDPKFVVVWAGRRGLRASKMAPVMTPENSHCRCLRGRGVGNRAMV